MSVDGESPVTDHKEDCAALMQDVNNQVEGEAKDCTSISNKNDLSMRIKS